MLNEINAADIVVLIVIAFFMFISYQRGLVKTLFNFCSTIIAVIAAKLLYPYVSAFILGMPVYEKIKISVIEGLGLNEVTSNATGAMRTQIINGLDLPDFIESLLLTNDNPEVYRALNTASTNVSEYIGAYIANIFINIVSMILVFIIIRVAILIISNILDLVTKLPIINMANKLGGMAVGFLEAVLVIWVVMSVITLFFVKGGLEPVQLSIESSKFARMLYDTNIILKMITSIFG